MGEEYEKYDVFLSHRGPDTKTGFVGFLYDGLKAAGLRPFLDCKSIDKGKSSWECIEHAIKTSPIAVVIFSERFAESEWCLRELHVMLESQPCVKVLPIFYKVRPFKVRRPESGQLRDGFIKLEGRCTEADIEQWKGDLKMASELMGWEPPEGDKRLEVELVSEVVRKVLELANMSLPLDVGEYVVGVEEASKQIIHTLEDRKEVMLLGLWGVGGIGKSTLARELYNQLSKRFTSRCYVEDVKEKVDHGGVVKVQNCILKGICTQESMVIEDKSRGKIILEERLSKKQILLVLDDVRDDEEMEYWISRKMLRTGSLCIVTSRNRGVFQKASSLDVKDEMYIHNVQLLSLENSEQVFGAYAFGGKGRSRPEFERLVGGISEACGGVPLVLKVCGAFLKGVESMEVWEEVLRKLNCGDIMDEKKIFECLMISYNALPQQQKEMFLDIACALLGEFVDDMPSLHPQILQPFPDSLRTLVIKSGRYDDLGFNLDLSHMKELRILGCDVINVTSVPPNLSFLRCGWLREGQHVVLGNGLICQSSCCKISPKRKLLILDIQCSEEIKLLPDSIWHFSNLEVLNLGWCSQLRKLPDLFGCLRNLRSLDLQDSGIGSLPESFGELSSLEVLNLANCWKLRKLPDSFGGLIKLKMLDLRDFGKRSLPESFGQLSKLVVLNLSCSNLIMLPDSFGRLRKLKNLDLQCSNIGNFPESFVELSNLKVLELRGCSKLRKLPDSFGGLGKLKNLSLYDSGIGILPEGLGELSNLEVLNLRSCKELRKLPDSFGSLVKLKECCVWGSTIGLGNVEFRIVFRAQDATKFV